MLIGFTLKEDINQVILTVLLSPFCVTIECLGNGNLPSRLSFSIKRLSTLSTQFSEERNRVTGSTIIDCRSQADGAAVPFPTMAVAGNRVPSVATISFPALDVAQWGADLMYSVVVGMSAHARMIDRGNTADKVIPPRGRLFRELSPVHITPFHSEGRSTMTKMSCKVKPENRATPRRAR